MPCLNFEGRWPGFGTRRYFRHNVVSCSSLKIGVGLASGQVLRCTNLRGLLRIRMTDSLVQGQPLAVRPCREAVWC